MSEPITYFGFLLIFIGIPFLIIAALKSRLSAITQPEGNASTPAIGNGFGVYNIEPATALDPASEGFITTFGDALALIQQDMRAIGKAPDYEFWIKSNPGYDKMPEEAQEDYLINRRDIYFKPYLHLCVGSNS